EKGKVTFGYNGRVKKRDFEAIQYNFNIIGAVRNPVNGYFFDPNNLDAFFNQQSFDEGLFSISAFAGDTPQTYNGEQNIHAGFANLEYRLTDKFSAVVGLRSEEIDQLVKWRTQLDADEKSNEFKDRKSVV